MAESRYFFPLDAKKICDIPKQKFIRAFSVFVEVILYHNNVM